MSSPQRISVNDYFMPGDEGGSEASIENAEEDRKEESTGRNHGSTFDPRKARLDIFSPSPYFPCTPEIVDSFMYHPSPEEEQQGNFENDDEGESCVVRDRHSNLDQGDSAETEKLDEDQTEDMRLPRNMRPLPKKSVSIPGEYLPETKRSPLLGARCIFCHVLINPAPIVQCLECNIPNPYICVECFKYGSEGAGHSRNHHYIFVDPKGPQLFKSQNGKRDFGIMEDVAILEMLCEFTRENWDQKNIIFPEITYEDALDRLEDIMMSDFGAYIRANDPLAQVRRIFPADMVESFRLHTMPSNIIKMRKSLPPLQTRFCEFLKATESVPQELISHYVGNVYEQDDGPLTKNKQHIKEQTEESIGTEDITGSESQWPTGTPKSTPLITPLDPNHLARKIQMSSLDNHEFADQVQEIMFDENGRPLHSDSIEDGYFRAALSHVQNLASKKIINGITVKNTKNLEPDVDERPFNPQKFFELLKERRWNLSKSPNRKTNDDIYPMGDISPDQLSRKDKKDRKKLRRSVSNADPQLPSSPEDSKRQKKPKKPKRLTFSQHMKLIEKRREKLAEYRRELREQDKQEFHAPSGGQDDSMEMGTLGEGESLPPFEVTKPARKNPEIPTAKELAFQRLDATLEIFHRRIGFKSVDDWGVGKEPERRKFKLKPPKTRLLSKHVREYKKDFDKKWNSSVQFEPWTPPITESDRPCSPGIPGTNEPTDGLYHVYEAEYEDGLSTDPKTIEDEVQVATYNRIRHDYDMENLNDAETLLNGMAKRHEPIDFTAKVKMCKLNTYERILKERSAQASIAREYNLLPTFMDITKTVTYPIGDFPFLDNELDSINLDKVKDKYRPFLIPLYQVCTKNMFDDYLRSIAKIEELKKKIGELQQLQKDGETELQD
ncbi:hypothetical protein FO519_000662 [Halicephalobus sp. NKZ332]|nr:hypothetical protein FO519_000662 [Halicephalobus sp. NKZ332]